MLAQCASAQRADGRYFYEPCYNGEHEFYCLRQKWIQGVWIISMERELENLRVSSAEREVHATSEALYNADVMGAAPGEVRVLEDNVACGAYGDSARSQCVRIKMRATWRKLVDVVSVGTDRALVDVLTKQPLADAYEATASGKA